jgi:hypothetical protein
MANNNAPYGFTPLSPDARKNAYSITNGYSTNLYMGDPVALTGTASGDGRAGIQLGVSGSDIVGVFAGCSYTDSSGVFVQSRNWPASTTATNIIAYVYDDPFTLFTAQMSLGLAVTDIGNKTQYITGTAVQGVSGYTLDSSAFGTGTDFQVMGVAPLPGNSVGNYAQVTGYFRLHTLNYPHTAV